VQTAGPKQADGLQAEGDVQAAWPKGITTHLFRPGSILGLAPSLAQSQVPPVSLPNCGLSVLFLTELAHVVLHTQSVFSVGLFFLVFFKSNFCSKKLEETFYCVTRQSRSSEMKVRNEVSQTKLITKKEV